MRHTQDATLGPTPAKLHNSTLASASDFSLNPINQSLPPRSWTSVSAETKNRAVTCSFRILDFKFCELCHNLPLFLFKCLLIRLPLPRRRYCRTPPSVPGSGVKAVQLTERVALPSETTVFETTEGDLGREVVTEKRKRFGKCTGPLLWYRRHLTLCLAQVAGRPSRALARGYF
eukprot:sb/3472011/